MKKAIDIDVTSKDMLLLSGEVGTMEYGIKELSMLAGVSARTLRYYDGIGLLKPLYTNEAGYRFYGDKEVALLQQILFYRERGLSLKQIHSIVYEEGFDMKRALFEHLQELEEKKAHVDALIRTVKQTIRSMEGEYEMSDKEKFEAFKERLVNENEEKYGVEIRAAYGDEEMDASNRRILQMSEEAYERFQTLGGEINKRLQEAVLGGVSPESDEARRIVALHKEWLGMTWREYSAEAHKAIANTYISDERFKLYYDKEVPGCADFLEQAIRHWAKGE